MHRVVQVSPGQVGWPRTPNGRARNSKHVKSVFSFSCSDSLTWRGLLLLYDRPACNLKGSRGCRFVCCIDVEQVGERVVVRLGVGLHFPEPLLPLGRHACIESDPRTNNEKAGGCYYPWEEEGSGENGTGSRKRRFH